jgi:Spy/CpxP family protein refolding chaperone
MKRLSLLLGALALIGLLGVSAQADDERPGPGYGMGYGMGPGYGMGYGTGPGYGMGPGMGFGLSDDEVGMPGGMMAYGMGYGTGYGMEPGYQMGALLEALTPEQREKLRLSHYAMQRQMIAKRAELQQARLTLAETLHAFPLNRSKAQEAYGKVNDARRALFDLRLGAMTQMQEIVGKELWERMRSGMGVAPGMGFPPGMGGGPRQR